MALLDGPLSPYGGAAALRRLYEVARKSGHKVLLDWLVFGSHVGAEITGRSVPEPSGTALDELLGIVEIVEPALSELLDTLIELGPRSAPLAIQKLMTTDVQWSHPIQVLERPRPTLDELEIAYDERYQDGDRSAAFLAIEERIRRAAAIARRAAARRRKNLKKNAPK